MPAAIAAARSCPTGSRAPAITSVGARPRRDARRVAPCSPAPPRGGWRPDRPGGFEAARRGAGRGGRGACVAWLAKTGSRSHSSTKASIPSRSSRSARASSAARRRVALGRVGDAGRWALEDEAADGGRVRDGQAQGDPRAERIAKDMGRRRAGASRIVGEVVGGPLDARAGRVVGDRRAAVARQIDGDEAEPPGERRRVGAPARPATGEAVEQEQRDAAPRAGPPSEDRRRRCRSRAARASATAAAASRCSSTLRVRSVRYDRTRTPGRPIESPMAAARSRGPDDRYSPPSAVTIGPTSMPWGVPNSSS